MTSSSSKSKRWDLFVFMLVKNRLFVGLAAVVITVLSIAGMPTIQSSADPTSYLPASLEDVQFWRDMSNRFSAFEVLMVGLEEPSAPLSSDGLARLARITDRLDELKAEGILWSRSLTNVQTQYLDEEGEVVADLMVPAIPRDKAGLDELATRIKADPQVPGAFVSHDLKAYIILLRADPRKDAGAIAGLVEKVVDEERGDMNAYYFGAPFVTRAISRQVYNQLPWVVPLFALGLAIVLGVWIRRPAVIGIVLASAIVPLVWWLGFLGLFRIEVTVAVLNGALLLLAVGAVVFARLAEARNAGRPDFLPRRSVMLLLGGLFAFFALSLLNRFAQAPLPYLAQFGEAMMLGFACLTLFAMLGAVPLLSLIQPKTTPAPKKERHQSKFETTGKRIVAVTLGIAFLAGGVWGASKLRFQINLSEMFSSKEATGQALGFFDKYFGGSDFVQINVVGDFMDPATLGQIHRLTDLLEGSKVFPDVRSVSQVVAFLNTGFGGGINWIPPERDALENIWFFLAGSEDVRAMVDADRKEGMITLRAPAKDTDYERMVSVVSKAIEDSKMQGVAGARERIGALTRIYGVTLPEGRLDEILDKASGTGDPARREARIKVILDELHDYMKSDASPFLVSDAGWEKLAALLKEEDLPLEGSLGAAIASLPEYTELQASEELAGRVAQMLLIRVRNLDREKRSLELADDLVASVDNAQGAFHTRARGVLADLLHGDRAPGNIETRISGFPAMIPKIEALLSKGLRDSALVLLAVFTVIAIWGAWRYPRRVRAIPEALVATVLTFAVGALIGIHVDSGSATLYLLPATMTWFLSPSLADEDAYQWKWPWVFAVAVAVAALSLLLIGVMPVTRLGAVLALGLVIPVVATAASSWLWDPIQAGRELLEELRPKGQ